jgi:hypothetical protein
VSGCKSSPQRAEIFVRPRTLNFHIGGRALGLFSVAARLKSQGDAAQYRVATDGLYPERGRMMLFNADAVLVPFLGTR